MKVEKPAPLQVYDCHKVYRYLKDKHDFTEECIEQFNTWICETYEAMIGQNCILSIDLEGNIGNPLIEKILKHIIDDFSEDGYEVLIKYSW